MTILVIDTCNSAGFLGLFHQVHSGFRHITIYQQQSEHILPQIDNLLREYQLSQRDLTAIALTRGPGSFTGIRVGVAVAKSLAYALNLPLFAFSSLHLLAQLTLVQNPDLTEFLLAVDAKMGEAYTAHFQRDRTGLAQLVGSEQLIKIPLLNLHNVEAVAVGNAWPAEQGTIAPEILNHEQQYLKAWQQLIHWAEISGQQCAALDLTPVYLRDNVVQSPVSAVSSN